MPALHLGRKAAKRRAVVQSAEYCLARSEHASECKPRAFVCKTVVLRLFAALPALSNPRTLVLEGTPAVQYSML